MFLNLLLFFIGFYILIKGAGLLVDGSTSLAQRLKISNFVIGLVIVGIGTSIPEFAITFIANIKGEGSIGLGTVIGSNTFNILAILGISALFFTLPFRRHWVSQDLIWNILAILAVILFLIPFNSDGLSRFEGLTLLVLFAIWLYWVVIKSNGVNPVRSRARDEVASPKDRGAATSYGVNPPEHKPLRILVLPLAVLFILAGLLGVILGGNWVVAGAEIIARELGMSEALIGLTIVGIGTSLPELAATFVAAFKSQPGIAVGNIIGSNIFDFLVILGAAALVKPIVFPPDLLFDITITLASAALLYLFMFVGKRNVLKRWQGLVFIVLYIVYLAYLVRKG